MRRANAWHKQIGCISLVSHAACIGDNSLSLLECQAGQYHGEDTQEACGGCVRDTRRHAGCTKVLNASSKADMMHELAHDRSCSMRMHVTVAFADARHS